MIYSSCSICGSWFMAQVGGPNERRCPAHEGFEPAEYKESVVQAAKKAWVERRKKEKVTVVRRPRGSVNPSPGAVATPLRKTQGRLSPTRGEGKRERKPGHKERVSIASQCKTCRRTLREYEYSQCGTCQMEDAQKAAFEIGEIERGLRKWA